MTTKPTNALYERRGRKYIPVAARWYEDGDCEQMKVGTFKLIYAYTDGGQRYEYNVTPATAPTVAALIIARQAMEEAICEAAKMRPTSHPYTKKQQEIIKRFQEEMGGMAPMWWTGGTAHEISEAAIKAVMEFKP